MNKVFTVMLCLCLALAACQGDIPTDSNQPTKAATAPPTVTQAPRLETEVVEPTPTWTRPAPTDTPQKVEVEAGGVLIVIGPNYDYRFYESLRRTIEKAGYPVYVASNTLEPIQGVYVGHGFEIQMPKEVPDLEADLPLEQVDVADFKALVFILGDDFRFYKLPEVRSLAQTAYEQGKIIGVNDWGIYLLAGIRVLEGVKVTSDALTCSSMEVDYGAICTNRVVEWDGQIVTSNPTNPSVRFARTILEAIE